MSCRNTPAGSLATTYAKRLLGLQDSQCTNLFHELTRNYAAQGNPTITEAEYNASLTTITRTIFDNTEIWRPGSSILARAEARLQRVANSGMPEPSIAYALINMISRAQTAQIAITGVLSNTSTETGIPLAEVRAEYQRLMSEYTTLSHPSNPNRSSLTNPPESTIPDIPKNNATLYAIDKLTGWIRCPSCDKGRYLGVNDPTHGNCCVDSEISRTAAQVFLNRMTSALREGRDINDVVNDNRRLFTIDLEGMTIDLNEIMNRGNANTNSELINQEIPANGSRQISLPWDMKSFQESYDKAKARIADGSNYFLTPDMQLESVPGGVTGGLGSRATGNSFGIEIEVDFPDDPYPYNARRELAKRLYAEGITMYPEVAGWHYVGPHRDGGNFTFGPKDWVCEFDRTVDNVEGERGVEIKSQIMFDEPETWKNLRRVCEIITELGGKPTPRTGLHVNVGGSKFPTDSPATHNSLLKLAAKYDDTIMRLAHNPLSANSHRGRRYCQPVQVPPEGFATVNQARAYANHYQAFNLNHLPDEGSRHGRSSRVEVRVWDSTLDPVRIQTAITLSLALVQGGIEKIESNGPEELAGAHRNKYNRRRLSGNEWEESTESFRSLVSFVSDLGAESDWHKDSLTSLFASSRWQSGQNYYEEESDENNEEDWDD